MALCFFFTKGRFVLSQALLFVLVLLSIVITIPVEERAGLCGSRAYVCLFCMRSFMSFFSSSLCKGLAVGCDCGTVSIFLLGLY